MKILALISARMCRFFAHFGVRTLIVLYLIDNLQTSDSRAFALNAILITLFELGSIFGGMIADRLLGFRRALLLGGALLTAGYASFMWQNHLIFTFGLLIMGGNLFISNLPALLGKLTAHDEKKQKKCFALMYSMQNLGALISIPLLGILKDFYGYGICFAIAAGVMGLGFLILLVARLPNTPSKEKKSWLPIAGFLSMPLIAILFMTNSHLSTMGLIAMGVVLAAIFLKKVFSKEMVLKEKRQLFLISLIACVIFFSVEDQIASSLILFADRVCDRTFFGMTIPPSLIGMVNPMIIILFGPLVAKAKNRVVLPFVASGLAMLTLSLFPNASILLLLGVVSVISLAELYIGPLVFEMAAESACEDKRGEVMGMVPIAFSLAFVLSGLLSKMVISQENISQVAAFSSGFQKMSILLLIAAFAIALLNHHNKCKALI